MDNLIILYYFSGNDGSTFIELKRSDYKDSKDKSKYVCWFRIKNNEPIKLNFINMNENIRFFIEGRLIINTSDSNKNTNSNKNTDSIFIEKNNSISLTYSSINMDYVKLCYDYWNKL